MPALGDRDTEAAHVPTGSQRSHSAPTARPDWAGQHHRTWDASPMGDGRASVTRDGVARG